jgi:hypothetical protein
VEDAALPVRARTGDAAGVLRVLAQAPLKLA